MAQHHRPTSTGSDGSPPEGAAPTAPRNWLLRLGAPPVAATALTATVALYMTLVAFGNITDFGTNQQFVQHVLSMDTTFKDPDLMWRAVESPAVQNAAYVAVIAWETLTACVLLTATWFWITGLRRDAYARARAASTVGLVMMLLLFGMGFLAVGGEWFAMWQSSDWNGLDAAARNVVLAAFTLLVVHLPGICRAGTART
ncbi:hypothetical protein GCM10010329_61820 [Streptomyces spiroverticillatus]|uniref:DUF2165 family protein n=1 Tax=Streptomyces finlayi TaxID=67296 RepID=A0A919CEA7_9ACTN|nr:DUF2165 domain-containing protein [Streptomyces finlayi]GHA30240.1 hypothetical protein GCM10010329_61820 [Streptomyces spiroverticillatus]GHD14991.1 hypothetical protein GCM10010334_74610 [Streptomyces finlayi]